MSARKESEARRAWCPMMAGTELEIAAGAPCIGARCMAGRLEVA